MTLSMQINLWLEEILQEEPVPFEINYLYLLIVKDIKTFHLEFVGSENESDCINFDYSPQLGEHFFYNFHDFNKFLFSLKLLRLNKKLITQFKNKKLQIAVFGKKILKTFKF